MKNLPVGCGSCIFSLLLGFKCTIYMQCTLLDSRLIVFPFTAWYLAHPEQRSGRFLVRRRYSINNTCTKSFFHQRTVLTLPSCISRRNSSLTCTCSGLWVVFHQGLEPSRQPLLLLPCSGTQATSQAHRIRCLLVKERGDKMGLRQRW